MEEPKTQDQTLNLLKAISGFVESMNDCFGSKQKALQLYARLISKTTIVDEVPIKRHIDAFRKFCTENKAAIMEKSHTKMVDAKISYISKVYINMDLIFAAATKNERGIIWKHILGIYALIDPQSKAKELLKDVLDKDGKTGKEEEFLTDIFDKVGNNIQPDGNPMAAVGSLMSSGIFTDIVGSMSEGLESGELDIGRLMGSMQGMVTGIGAMAEQNGESQQPEMAQMLGQMSEMMGNLNKMSGKPDEVNANDLARGTSMAQTIIKNQGGTVGDTVGGVIATVVDTIITEPLPLTREPPSVPLIEILDDSDEEASSADVKTPPPSPPRVPTSRRNRKSHPTAKEGRRR